MRREIMLFCGSTAMIGMLLVLAAWGEKKRR
jgi:hypothetical protein